MKTHATWRIDQQVGDATWFGELTVTIVADEPGEGGAAIGFAKGFREELEPAAGFGAAWALNRAELPADRDVILALDLTAHSPETTTDSVVSLCAAMAVCKLLGTVREPHPHLDARAGGVVFPH